MQYVNRKAVKKSNEGAIERSNRPQDGLCKPAHAISRDWRRRRDPCAPWCSVTAISPSIDLFALKQPCASTSESTLTLFVVFTFFFISPHSPSRLLALPNLQELQLASLAISWTIGRAQTSFMPGHRYILRNTPSRKTSLRWGDSCAFNCF